MAKVDLESLNDLQKEAVLYNEGPLTILSVAGSGKTRTLTTKIAYLTEELGIRPGRIWACTFTKKAANEMQERLSGIIGEKADFVKLSTIHSLAFKLWKQGMRSKEPWWECPKILSNEGIAQSALYKFLKKHSFPSKDAKEYLAKISLFKLDRIRPKDVKQRIEANTGYPIRWDKPHELKWEESVYLVYKEYERWKEEKDYIDFQDMLLNCIDLLENPRFESFVSKVQRNCEYLLVDEAQDTNTIAFKIMKIIGDQHRNISIIGDLRQSIYGFQGAKISNAKQFINEYNPKMINLNINYRSSRTIVENANEVIAKSTEVIGEPAITPNPEGERIRLIGNYGLAGEGQNILDLVKHMHDVEGHDWKDIAVLYRIHSQSREIEDQFLLNEIPYVIFSKTSFYNRKEIKDLLCYLEIALHPDKADIKQYKRIANRPVRYITNKTFNEVDDIADDLEIHHSEIFASPWDYISDGQLVNSIEKLMGDITLLRRYINQGKETSEIFRFILESLGYKEWAINEKKMRDVDDDVEMNFESLIGSVHKFKDPQDFLDFVDDIKNKEKKKKDENGNYIKMMSIHASKGKEFPVVIIAGMCNRTYPFYKAVEEGNVDEERRVMYVALTRPKSKLILSNILSRYGKFKVNTSPYLMNMNVNVQRDMEINDIYNEIDFEIHKEMERVIRLPSNVKIELPKGN